MSQQTTDIQVINRTTVCPGMAIIKTFLCWSNTRTGTAVCGYYTLVISVLCLAFYLFRYIGLDVISTSIEFRGIVYAGFVLYSLMIAVSLVLLPGVYMDRRYLLLPWIYVLVVTVLYETGAVALLTTVHVENEKTMSSWEIVSVCFYCFRLIANCYCFACVVSQYQELSEGRGTYDYLYKPNPRMRREFTSMSNLDTYNPPYGVQLPYYSHDDPHKDCSPPNYENISIRLNDSIDMFYTTSSSPVQCENCNANDDVIDSTAGVTYQRTTYVTWI